MAFNKRGMTLLELVIAVGLFAAAFMYISKMTRAQTKRWKKINIGIEKARLKENILAVIREDLKNALFFYDVHYAMTQIFPVKQPDNEILPLERPTANTKPPPQMDRRFGFLGDSGKLQFTTSAWIQTKAEAARRLYVVKVDYFLRNCPSLQGKEGSRCLARGVSLDWENIEDDSNQDVTNMLGGIQSMQFTYFDDGEWHKEWRLSQKIQTAQRSAFAKASLFPSIVKIDLRQEEGKEESFQFTAGHHLLNAHRPGHISGLAFLKRRDASDAHKNTQDAKPLTRPDEGGETTRQETGQSTGALTKKPLPGKPPLHKPPFHKPKL